MGDFLRVLKDDHARTTKMMPRFEEAVAELSGGSLVGAQALVNYVTEEVVERHFKLEEDVLFPAIERMLKNYLPKEEPIRMLKLEHMAIARTVDEMRDAMMRADLKTASEKGEYLLSLLRQHIFREENGPFAMAEKYLNDEEKAKIEASLKSAGPRPRPPSSARRTYTRRRLWREGPGSVERLRVVACCSVTGQRP